MSQPVRIGEILIEQGVLNEQQVLEIVQAQKRLRLPFGLVAERLHDVTLESIERAWAEQYHRFTGTLDLETQAIDPEATRLITRRQAWQFEILPIGFDEAGELVIAASRGRLARAVTFVAGRLEPVAYFRIAEEAQLRGLLREHYPMPEVSPEMLDKARDFGANPNTAA